MLREIDIQNKTNDLPWELVTLSKSLRRSLYITAEKIQTTLTRLILHSFNHPLKVGVLPAALHILIMTGYDHHGRHEGDLPMSLLIPEMEEYEHVIDENVPDGW